MSIESIVSGIVSGLLASGILTIVLFAIKPKIKIAKEACIDRDRGILSIKFVNMSRVDLIDVNYSLFYCLDKGDGNVNVQEIPPIKPRLRSVDKYDKKNPEHPYAVCITYDIAVTTGFGTDNPKHNSFFEFSVCSRHSLSNAIGFTKERYTLDEIIEGRYETKKSTTILRA